LVLWYFGKFWQQTTKQRLSILYRPINEVQKLDIFGNKVFVHDNDRLCCKLHCNVISLATLAQVESRVKISMEARSCNFQTDSYKFRKGKITGAQRSNLSPDFPKMEDYYFFIRAKTARNLRKLRESCAPQHRNFWWDYSK